MGPIGITLLFRFFVEMHKTPANWYRCPLRREYYVLNQGLSLGNGFKMPLELDKLFRFIAKAIRTI